MNKLMIATDIHGSYTYAKMVVDKFCASSCDKLLLLGDIYYHGPRNPLPDGYDPMAVSQLLNGLGDKLIVVKGNCDSEVDQMISTFEFQQTAQLTVGDITIMATHGHKGDKNNLPQGDYDILVYGHYHINEIVVVEGVVAVNVGSASLPKDNYHGYCIVDEAVTLYNLLDDSVLMQHKL